MQFTEERNWIGRRVSGKRRKGNIRFREKADTGQTGKMKPVREGGGRTINWRKGESVQR